MPGQADVVKSVLVKIQAQSGQQAAQPFKDVAKAAVDADNRIKVVNQNMGRMTQAVGQNFNRAREGVASLTSSLTQLGRGMKPIEDLVEKTAMLANTMMLIKGIGSIGLSIAGGVGAIAGSGGKAASPGGGSFASDLAANTVGSIIGNRLASAAAAGAAGGAAAAASRTAAARSAALGIPAANAHHLLPGGISPARAGFAGGLAGQGNTALVAAGGIGVGAKLTIVGIAAAGLVLADSFINKLRGEKSTLQVIFEGLGFGGTNARMARMSAVSARLRGGLGEALAATRDEAAAMASFRGQTVAPRLGMAMTADFFLRRSAQNAPFAFRSPSEQTALAATREQAGELAKTSAEKLVGAAQARALAEASKLRYMQEQSRVADEMETALRQHGIDSEEYAAAQERGAQSAEKAKKAQDEVLAAIRQQSAVQVEVMQQWASFAKQQRNHWQGIVDQQKESRMNFAEQFGMMNRADRNRLGRIAQRFEKDPSRVRPEDLQELGRVGVFKDLVRSEAMRRAENDPLFRRLAQQSGVDQRIAQADANRRFFAEVEVKITQQVEAKLTADTESLASQIIRQATPQYHALIHQTVEALRDAVKRELIEVNANRFP